VGEGIEEGCDCKENRGLGKEAKAGVYIPSQKGTRAKNSMLVRLSEHKYRLMPEPSCRLRIPDSDFPSPGGLSRSVTGTVVGMSG
jgi:hypothetical protein